MRPICLYCLGFLHLTVALFPLGGTSKRFPQRKQQAKAGDGARLASWAMAPTAPERFTWNSQKSTLNRSTGRCALHASQNEASFTSLRDLVMGGEAERPMVHLALSFSIQPAPRSQLGTLANTTKEENRNLSRGRSRMSRSRLRQGGDAIIDWKRPIYIIFLFCCFLSACMPVIFPLPAEQTPSSFPCP